MRVCSTSGCHLLIKNLQYVEELSASASVLCVPKISTPFFAYRLKVLVACSRVHCVRLGAVCDAACDGIAHQCAFAVAVAINWSGYGCCFPLCVSSNKVVASEAPTRVRVPSSAAQIARRTFTLNPPWNTGLHGVAVIPHVFYTRYCCRLGTSLLFVDQHGDTHHLTLHRRRFSGTLTSGLGELMEFYRLERGEMLEVKFAGRNTFHIKVGYECWGDFFEGGYGSVM
ncbi:hypothetical protein PIB30_014364 [Stylosanthes scabra]|uniref:Uncharacterized protein n=1 Tax=Stylosanthes scabra TaxID=79078 RepID=A0ABU6S6M6_9FABA|nr:hypothetical protein [Stylosanthes scabra]